MTALDLSGTYFAVAHVLPVLRLCPALTEAHLPADYLDARGVAAVLAAAPRLRELHADIACGFTAPFFLNTPAPLRVRALALGLTQWRVIRGVVSRGWRCRLRCRWRCQRATCIPA